MRTLKLWHLLAILGLASAVTFLDCGQGSNPSETKSETATTSAESDHQHEHKAPHGGTLVELGEEFAHIEFVLDPSTGRLTAYVLDGEAENAVRLKQKEIELLVNSTSLKLVAVENPLTGEKSGDSSEFQVVYEPLKGEDHFTGVVLKVDIKGQTFQSVKFEFPEGHDSHHGTH